MNLPPLTTHYSPITNLHIRFLVAAGLEQVVESAGQFGGVRLVLGVEPAQRKTDGQARDLAVLGQGADLIGGRLKDEIKSRCRRADRAVIMPGDIRAERQVTNCARQQRPDLL